jgi:hypothetical protein
MKKLKMNIILVCIFLAISGNSCQQTSNPSVSPTNSKLDSLLTPISEINTLYSTHDTSGVEVTVKGNITAILSDDTVGDKHQRFIIELGNNQTILITHNIDLAPRVVGISVGSLVYVHGEYIWNNQGGIIHWTHIDPAGVHENGWVVFGDNKYQ